MSVGGTKTGQPCSRCIATRVCQRFQSVNDALTPAQDFAKDRLGML
jgi:uncharacterized protein YcbX